MPRRLSPEHNLARTHPAVAAEWYPTLNGGCTPADVTPGSDRSVWWRCATDPAHAWRARVNNRCGIQPTGCPACAGRVVTADSSLAATRPDVAAEWHATNNRDLTPGDVTAGSQRVVWWQCGADGAPAWEAKVAARTRPVAPAGCPYCAGRRVAPADSLAARRPDLAAQWHPARNGGLRPEAVGPGSSRRVWWRCVDLPAHEWATTVYARTRPAGSPRCPYCSRRKRLVRLTTGEPLAGEE
jgi:hypothetical protein